MARLERRQPLPLGSHHLAEAFGEPRTVGEALAG